MSRNAQTRGGKGGHLRDALRVGATFSCHLGAFWQLHVTVWCRWKVTWWRRASPEHFHRAVHALVMLCRLSFYALVRKVLGGYGRGPTAFDGLFGRPGEVGGRAKRAELTECALRLCVCVERGGTTCAWSERVLVMAMVTERVSPAK
jgi:hypothetical protein